MSGSNKLPRLNSIPLIEEPLSKLGAALSMTSFTLKVTSSKVKGELGVPGPAPSPAPASPTKSCVFSNGRVSPSRAPKFEGTLITILRGVSCVTKFRESDAIIGVSPAIALLDSFIYELGFNGESIGTLQLASDGTLNLSTQVNFESDFKTTNQALDALGEGEMLSPITLTVTTQDTGLNLTTSQINVIFKGVNDSPIAQPDQMFATSDMLFKVPFIPELNDLAPIPVSAFDQGLRASSGQVEEITAFFEEAGLLLPNTFLFYKAIDLTSNDFDIDGNLDPNSVMILNQNAGNDDIVGDPIDLVDTPDIVLDDNPVIIDVPVLVTDPVDIGFEPSFSSSDNGTLDVVGLDTPLSEVDVITGGDIGGNDSSAQKNVIFGTTADDFVAGFGLTDLLGNPLTTLAEARETYSFGNLVNFFNPFLPPLGIPAYLSFELNALLDLFETSVGQAIYAANDSGINSFQYKISDLGGKTSTTSATVGIISFADEEACAASGDPTGISILTNENISFGENGLMPEIITGPMNGTVVFDNENSQAIYTSNSGFIGTDSFTYGIRDPLTGQLLGNATTTIEVLPGIQENINGAVLGNLQDLIPDIDLDLTFQARHEGIPILNEAEPLPFFVDGNGTIRLINNESLDADMQISTVIMINYFNEDGNQLTKALNFKVIDNDNESEVIDLNNPDDPNVLRNITSDAPRLGLVNFPENLDYCKALQVELSPITGHYIVSLLNPDTGETVARSILTGIATSNDENGILLTGDNNSLRISAGNDGNNAITGEFPGDNFIVGLGGADNVGGSIIASLTDADDTVFGDWIALTAAQAQAYAIPDGNGNTRFHNDELFGSTGNDILIGDFSLVGEGLGEIPVNRASDTFIYKFKFPNGNDFNNGDDIIKDFEAGSYKFDLTQDGPTLIEEIAPTDIIRLELIPTSFLTNFINSLGTPQEELTNILDFVSAINFDIVQQDGRSHYQATLQNSTQDTILFWNGANGLGVPVATDETKTINFIIDNPGNTVVQLGTNDSESSGRFTISPTETDIIYGLGGNDQIAGDYNVVESAVNQFSDDFLIGGADNDLLFGDIDILGAGVQLGTNPPSTNGPQLGDDVLIGEGGSDLIVGDIGTMTSDSKLFFPTGADIILGGNGDDILIGDIDSIRGDDDPSSSIEIFLTRPDIIFGGGENDFIIGDIRDQISADVEITGGDRLNGDTGEDHIFGDISVLSNGKLTTAGDDIIGGGPGNDVLVGDVNQIVNSGILENAGNDTITGGSGNDMIWGDVRFIEISGALTNPGSDTFMYNLAVGLDNGDDVIGDFNEFLNPGTPFDTLAFINVRDVASSGPSTTPDGLINSQDLFALTNISESSNGSVVVNMFSDSAQSQSLGSVTLDGVDFIDGSDNLADYATIVSTIV